MKPNYQRIHTLEWDLGLTDEKPPGGPQSSSLAASILKDLYAPCIGLRLVPSPPSPKQGTSGSTSS